MEISEATRQMMLIDKSIWRGSKKPAATLEEVEQAICAASMLESTYALTSEENSRLGDLLWSLARVAAPLRSRAGKIQDST